MANPPLIWFFAMFAYDCILTYVNCIYFLELHSMVSMVAAWPSLFIIQTKTTIKHQFWSIGLLVFGHPC